MTIAASKFKDTSDAKKGKAGTETATDPSGPAYGIRSHLHEFYDWRSAWDTTAAGGDAWYLIGGPAPSVHRRRLIYALRILTIVGLILLVVGAVLILVGYMWHESPLDLLKEPYVKETRDGIDYVPADILDVIEEKRRLWKLAGLMVFACGGTILAVSLLIPTCARLLGRDTLTSDLNTPIEPPVKIFAATPPTLVTDFQTPSGKKGAESPPTSPTERRVPAMEEITAVQPKSAPLAAQRRASGDELLLMEEDESKRP